MFSQTHRCSVADGVNGGPDTTIVWSNSHCAQLCCCWFRKRVQKINQAYKELRKSLADHLTGKKAETEKTKVINKAYVGPLCPDHFVKESWEVFLPIL